MAVATATWTENKFRLDFRASAEGGLMWSRYFLLTCLRAAKYDAATLQAVVNCVDVPATDTFVGPAWAVAQYPNSEWLVLLTDGGSPSSVWVPQKPLTAFVTNPNGPGKVDPTVQTLATAIWAGVKLQVGTPRVLHLCGMGRGAQAAPAVAYAAKHDFPAVDFRILEVAPLAAGDLTFNQGINRPWDTEINPWDPVCWLPTFTAGNGGLFGIGASPAAPYSRSFFGAPWAGGFGHVPPTHSDFWNRRYNTYVNGNNALVDVSNNVNSVANHLLFFYLTRWWERTTRYVPSNRQAIGQVRGYDLEALDTMNALLSSAAFDAFVAGDEWPVPMPNWPHV